MKETTLMHQIRSELNRTKKVRLWRNNTGMIGGVRFGLAIGSADLIGVMKGGTFVSIEVKTTKGRETPEQEIWRETVQSFGGIAFTCRSLEEAVQWINSQ